MNPEVLSAAWFSALGAIILIDLVLAGDNAIVIGLAARNVPKEMQRRVILWGTAGAIVVRALLTAVVVWLLKIPLFMLAGGLALVWIGWKLTQDGGGDGHAVKSAATVKGAIRTIVVADAVMGVDNVLAVGGAAHGSMLLVVIGLAVSIPIVIWGSGLVVRWVERFPAILWLGAGVLGWTAAKMIGSEPLLAPWLDATPWLRSALQVAIVGGLVALPLWRSLAPAVRGQAVVLAFMVVWLSVWGFLARQLDVAWDPIDDWQFDNQAFDLIRWLGWIPFALLLHRRMGAAGTATGATER